MIPFPLQFIFLLHVCLQFGLSVGFFFLLFSKLLFNFLLFLQRVQIAFFDLSSLFVGFRLFVSDWFDSLLDIQFGCLGVLYLLLKLSNSLVIVAYQPRHCFHMRSLVIFASFLFPDNSPQYSESISRVLANHFADLSVLIVPIIKSFPKSHRVHLRNPWKNSIDLQIFIFLQFLLLLNKIPRLLFCIGQLIILFLFFGVFILEQVFVLVVFILFNSW